MSGRMSGVCRMSFCGARELAWVLFAIGEHFCLETVASRKLHPGLVGDGYTLHAVFAGRRSLGLGMTIEA